MYSREYVIGLQNVKEFVNVTGGFIEEIDLVRGRYVIDAKSIMGIFSLDLSKPVDIVMHTDDAARAEEFFKKVEDVLRG